MNERSHERAPRARRGWWLAVLVIASGCGTDTADPDARAPCVAPATGSSPTFTQLYTKYFASGTPGHCATGGCHLSEADSTGWVCGTSKATCYQGMVGIGLIDTQFPQFSVIADPK
ncbi:MAG TPA: hypothetical protein VFK02_22620, partial [Kofleriaceae bacterium]|nr:hypothetical protein [Kofleriaceae bacterium]